MFEDKLHCAFSQCLLEPKSYIEQIQSTCHWNQFRALTFFFDAQRTEYERRVAISFFHQYAPSWVLEFQNADLIVCITICKISSLAACSTPELVASHVLIVVPNFKQVVSVTSRSKINQ